MLPYTCGGCNNGWGGYRTAHCASCHETFSGVTVFDEHRKDGICQLPEKVGMKYNRRGTGENAYRVWGYPMDDETREQFARRRS